ncbi:MAG: hypothetical protein WKG07_25680 [Hymenobacter sp.]
MVRGWGDDGHYLHFSNTRATGHVENLELHYRSAREMGLTRFRDTVLWDEARHQPDYTWLDRLAAVSEGQIELVLNHYALPEWLTEEMFWTEGAAGAACASWPSKSLGATKMRFAAIIWGPNWASGPIGLRPH